MLANSHDHREGTPLPDRSTDLKHCSYRELADAYPDRYRPDLARSLTNLGIHLSALGRLDEALPVAEEAVTIYRELADAYPDRYRPDLAASLTNLGMTLSALGRLAEAEGNRREAERIQADFGDT